MRLKSIVLSGLLLSMGGCASDSQRGISQYGQTKGTDIVPDGIQREKRVALVIGNERYQYFNHLNTPKKDAKDMANTLRAKGFEVIELVNGNRNEMQSAIEKFSYKLKSPSKDTGTGIFYYSGHGVEVDGKNYLLPIDTHMPSRANKDNAIAMNLVVDNMEYAKSRFNIIILDACRSYPNSKGGGGLAQMNTADGMLLAYATKPGGISEAGRKGENSLYTKHLLREMNSTKNIENIFKNVGWSVKNDPNNHHNQRPWMASSMYGDFYFRLPVLVTPTYVPSKKIPNVYNNSVQRIANSKWITLKRNTCLAHRGKFEKGECIANWSNAKKICHQNRGRLASIKELNDVINSCGGKDNQKYKSCYYSYGFRDNYEYWSSSTQKNMTFNAHVIFFPEAKTYVQGKETDAMVAIKCMK